MNAPQRQDDLLARIRGIWESARSQAARSVNTAHVCANWLIGQQIVEAEQSGAERAGYGKALLKLLSERLVSEYGSGFSVSALQYMRSFFLSYPQLLEKQHAVRVEFDSQATPGALQNIEWRPGLLHPSLSWTHYRTLLKVERRRRALRAGRQARAGLRQPLPVRAAQRGRLARRNPARARTAGTSRPGKRDPFGSR